MSSGGGGGGDGGSRVSIPADLLKTIQNIREMTGKQHSDEDIYSVFKDCFNDPHETAQKLMYLDTFQEVKSKRERKKENLVTKTQERGRSGRRNSASRYTDANNGRSAGFKRQTGPNHMIGGGSRTALPAPNKAIKAPNPTSPPSGISNHKTQDVPITFVNKGIAEEQPLAKTTSSSEDGVDLGKSKATVVPVAVSVSDSIVQNDTQCTLDGTSQISQQPSTFTKQDATSNCSSQSGQVTRSEAAANKGKKQSLLQSDVGERPHVTFPVHLQVAKMLENGLTFGSFSSELVKEASSDNCTNGCNDSNIESSHETAASAREDMSTFSQGKDHEVSNSAPKAELALQSDQTVHPVEGSVGDKLVEELSSVADTHQAAKFDGPPISYPDQCSMAASQQAMHLLAQQYPPNFFPYGPYFPPFYMPQPYSHQYLSANGFQQQSYIPPGDDAPTPPGPKPSLPHIKSGSDNGNSTPTTIPSPYDSYTFAFNHIPSAPTVNSTNKEEKKENIYTNGPLSLANLQASAMYNLSLQGQRLAFPIVQPGFTGVYQQTQPIPPAPTISGMTEEAIGLPHMPNQPTQAALTNLSNNN